jgi:mono/diheme cytochrome c family protein
VLRVLSVLVLSSAAATAAPGETATADAARFFELNCQSCHTIGGGRLAGPDLKGVLARRDRDWLVRFVQNPKVVIDGGDAYAQALFQEARGVYMPTLPGMSPKLAGDLVDLIEAESALEKSRFIGLQISDRPLTEADVKRGEELFHGIQAFASGAPACTSCHTTQGIGALGGGRLGPDLTEVYARLEGRKALAAWLSAPSSPTMQPVFRDKRLDGEEVLALVAYLKSEAERGVAPAGSAAVAFTIAGIGIASLLLVVLDFVWRQRYRAVRRPLVSGT